MKDCEFCRKPMLAEHEISNSRQHTECFTIWVARIKSHVCSMCGEVDTEDVCCNDCTQTGEYKGYNGPAEQ